jgi:hypothetical protein
MVVGEKKPVSSQYRSCRFVSPVNLQTCSAVKAKMFATYAPLDEFVRDIV